MNAIHLALGRAPTTENKNGGYLLLLAGGMIELQVTGVGCDLVDVRSAKLPCLLELNNNYPAILEKYHIGAAPALARQDVLKDCSVVTSYRMQSHDCRRFGLKNVDFAIPRPLLCVTRIRQELDQTIENVRLRGIDKGRQPTGPRVGVIFQAHRAGD